MQYNVKNKIAYIDTTGLCSSLQLNCLHIFYLTSWYINDDLMYSVGGIKSCMQNAAICLHTCIKYICLFGRDLCARPEEEPEVSIVPPIFTANDLIYSIYAHVLRILW